MPPVPASKVPTEIEVADFILELRKWGLQCEADRRGIAELQTALLARADDESRKRGGPPPVRAPPARP
jgi:hypothetical protein